MLKNAIISLPCSLAFFLFSGAEAATSAAISRVGEALHIDVARPHLTATVKEGFHFNLKAPNQLSGFPSGAIHPKTASERKIEVDLPDGRAIPAGAALVLYVCDDANTFCDIERRELAGLLAEPRGKSKEVAAPATKSKAAAEEKPDAHGFYHHDFSSLLQRAAREKKIVMAEFGARWCPGCQRLSSEVLTQKSMRAEISGFLKYYADIDLFESFDLSKKYVIHGVPTLLFLDSEGAEITRLVDYRPTAVVKALVKEVRDKPVSLDKLKDRIARAGDKAKNDDLLLLGRRLLTANRFDEALKVLERVQPPPAELFQARVERAAKLQKDEPSDAHRTALRATLEEALKNDKGTLRSLAWRGQLAALLDKGSEPRKALVTEARATVEKWLGDPSALKASLIPEIVGEFHGLERFFVAISWAEFLDELGDQGQDVGAAWRKAADIGKASGITVKEAGPGLRYLIVLIAAENFDEADRWVQSMIARYPENKDLLRRRARILNSLKRYEEAAKVGEESRKVSDGRVEFLVVEQLAKSYIGLGKTDKAKAILDEVLARTEIQSEQLKEQRKKLADLRHGL